MPIPLSFTTMTHSGEFSRGLQDLLAKYGQAQHIGFSHRETTYETGWEEFVRGAIYGGGVDISEMGSTWVSDFASMSALRPFSLPEIARFGGSASFPPGLWQSGLSADGSVSAIPWMTNVSLVYFRRDLLARAGAEETSAFSTPEYVEQTLARLQAVGVHRPWAVPTCRSRLSLHNLAMWMWYHGADFVDQTGKNVTINTGEGRAALKNYFGLARFFPAGAEPLAENQSDDLFATGQAAATISGSWLLRTCTPEVRQNLGLALPLGKATLGGFSLVIWNNARQVREALDLITHLIHRIQQISMPQHASLLPSKRGALEQFPLDVDRPEIREVFIRALNTGQTLPAVPLWGMIEDRLVRILQIVWSRLLESPGAELDSIFDADLAPAIARLNASLSNY
jgi:ABC-type glycerol-3-phosphate transport system substrate-binding protein